MTSTHTGAPQILLSLSGGLDSTVLCASFLEEHGPGSVSPVFFRYGSKHNPWEKKAAAAVAAHYNLALTVIDLTATFANVASALLAADSRAIPQKAYDDASMAATVVPGRNLLFASVMAAVAESRAIPHMALATHGGDHHLYPDCRPEFNTALAKVVDASTAGRVAVTVPFAAMSKANIVALGLRLNAPLRLTRSCYAAAENSCGRCGTCTERLAAFAANGAVDPALCR